MAVIKGQMSRFAFMNNPYRVIKLLVFVTGLCIASCTTALAQQQSLYVYLQSENQPFYVQMGDKVYSSSAIGHLVIAGLPDKTCNFEIGFPQHTTQPQHFSIPLRNKDHGYQLVKNGSRGWALYDWQTDETIKPLKESGSSSLLYGERKKDDAFATLMAAVVNDSAVLYTSIVKKESESVPSVVNTNAKPAEKQLVEKKEEKPVKTVDTQVTVEHVDVVTAPISSSPSVDSSKLVKNEAVVVTDTTSGIQKNTADTLVTKYDPKEKGLNEKPVVSGVAKIQQQTKDGETKMVFIDSSETPAKVVTVYISEDKKPADEKQEVQTQAPAVPVENTPAKNVVKSEAKQEPVPQPVKQELVVEPVKKEETAKKEESTKKDTDKGAPALTKEEIAEQIKKETWKQAPGKKAPGDTVTIILESRQMKKSAAAVDEPAPLYRSKEEPKTEPVKPAAKPDTAVVQMTAPARQEVADAPKVNTSPAVEEKKEVKQEPIKPAAEKAVVKTEPETKKPSEPESKPAVDTLKKAVMQPVTTQKEPEAVVKTETQPVLPKAAEPEKPKAVELEKKTETSNKLVMINSDCAKLATDNDVDKMRVKMLAESDLQKKLAVANKNFKLMCLYARQIKALSELFPGDEAKYKFLEMAYPFAADTANFKQLYDLLTEEVFVTKFKKLVRLQ